MKKTPITSLLEGKSIILFRFHDEPSQARERIRILRHYNPKIDVYVLFGGKRALLTEATATVQDLVSAVWYYDSPIAPQWKWLHGDLILKAWYRDFGHTLDFDFLFSYEYDLLTLKPLNEIYPNIDTTTVALSACEDFTKEIESTWSWTSEPQPRAHYLRFSEYMLITFGLKRQQKICLGPGPLFPKNFLDIFSQTADYTQIHEELAYPAYAQALGFKLVDHGMHAGLMKSDEATRFFTCEQGHEIATETIQEELIKPDGCRAFHAVKQPITIEDLNLA